MLPLKIAILWHQHQPYYKKEDEFLLPWVRLHGVKDYFDLLEFLHEFPDMKQTFNIVPSLLMQVDEYISGKTRDKVQRLSLIPPQDLNEEDKREILRLFFLCNVENMILPYPRYHELYLKAENVEFAVAHYTNQDWCDLQVWYNLTWIGYFSRERSAVRRLFNKGAGFTDKEKHMLLDIHNDILAQIKPELKYLMQIGQLEVCCSPVYHPILPLLCESGTALEAMPHASMPEPHYVFPEDAEAQIKNANEYFRKCFGEAPAGMWPSEGSVSNRALALMSETGLKWAASDEQVLSSTRKDNYDPLEKYFPRIFESGANKIAVLFRDHQLSDAIGFIYSRWNAADAAGDFYNRLIDIREEIIDRLGEDALEHAVVPVILDGENCWEFYKNNGVDFLRELYGRLTDTDELVTVTCAEAVRPEHCYFYPPINNIRAGSWINADFKIWIGHPEDVAAWNMLGKARLSVKKAKSKISPEAYKNAMEEIYIAEGSDWFWWYGDEHVAANKNDFDHLFRWHIEEVYRYIGHKPPQEVYQPISAYGGKLTLAPQTGEVHPVIDGRQTDPDEWKNAGYYDAISSMGAMHQVGELLHRLWYASNDKFIYLRCDIVHDLSEDDIIELKFISPAEFSLILHNHSFSVKSLHPLTLSEISFAARDLIEISISKSVFFGNDTNGRKNVDLMINTRSKENELIYPRQGILTIEI